MELIDPSWKKVERLHVYVQRGLFILAILCSLAELVALGWPSSQVAHGRIYSPWPACDFSNIGSGALGFTRQPLSPLGELLAEELVVMGKNHRPDVAGQSVISIGIKSSGDQREVRCGEKLYLSSAGESYRFSETKSEVALLPISSEGEEVVFHIEPTSEQLRLKPSQLFRTSQEDEPYLQAVRKGKLWGSDQLLHSFGGEEYYNLGIQHKVELGSRVYFLSVGATLWWDGNAWVPEGCSGECQGAPLAQLISSHAEGLQMEVWDQTGYEHVKVEVPLQHSLPSTLKPNEMMTAVRPRSPTEITCQLGARRVIVHEGDWWLKTGRRWRPVRTSRDLEALLHHEIQGELVMFEKIEVGKGNVTVRGRCFDRMRVQSQPLLLTLSTEKKASSSHHKSGSSHSAMAAKNKMAPPQLGQRHDEDQP
jgi:hypothetical protein